MILDKFFKLKMYKILTIIIVVFPLYDCNLLTPRGELYFPSKKAYLLICSEEDFKGECRNFTYREFPNGLHWPQCLNFDKNLNDKMTSINTHGKCIRLYEDFDCFGKSISVFPGSQSHNNFTKLNFNRIASSFGQCFIDDTNAAKRARQLKPYRIRFFDDVVIGILAIHIYNVIDIMHLNREQNSQPIVRYQTGYQERVQFVDAIIYRHHLDSGTGTNRDMREFARRMANNTYDDAGHIIARRLGGRGDLHFNIFPQNQEINRGAWRDIEALIYALVLNYGRVRFRVYLRYTTNTATRPDYLLFRIERGPNDVFVLNNDMLNPEPPRNDVYVPNNTIPTPGPRIHDELRRRGLNPSSESSIIVCTQEDFKGECIEIPFSESMDCQNIDKDFNDKIASLNTGGKCIYLYEHANCSGRSVGIRPGSPSHNNLKLLNFYRITSSMKCGECCNKNAASNGGRRKRALSKCFSMDNNDNKIFNKRGEDIKGVSLVSASNCNKRIVGYYPSWSKYEFSRLQAQRLTHVIYAFLEMKYDGSIEIHKDFERQRLEQLMKTASAFPHLKIMFAVGGWDNSQYFSLVVASSIKRKHFVASVVKMIETYSFDGVDIDWEYPVTGGANEGVTDDKKNYVILMKELRQALDSFTKVSRRSEKLLLSFAGAAGQWTLDPGFNLPDLLKYADFVNIMTYDYYGAWSSKWGAYTGPPSPLFFGTPPKYSGKNNVDWSVKYYVCKTKEPHKINMGVPFYGRFWRNVGPPVDRKDGMWRMASATNGKFEGGHASWKEIQGKWLNQPEFEQYFHKKSKSPYAWNSHSSTFLGYENIDSLKFKIEYAVGKNLGGIMIWAIDQDDDNLSLLNTVYSAPLCEKTNPNEINYKCPPISEKRWWTLKDGEDVAGLCGRSAPLYKGFYPVCDPDDPAYSCCGPHGYCGSGDEYCKCPTCVDYGKNPEKIAEEPIKPSISVQWYFLDADDGKRGRCGRNVPKLNNDYPICNPDDKNSYCCSNGNYCGNTIAHCDCDGCVNFKLNPNYKFGPKKWWDWSDGPEISGKCGPSAPKVDGIYEAECDPNSKYYCCSKYGSCGSGPDFCDCDGCKNFQK